MKKIIFLLLIISMMFVSIVKAESIEETIKLDKTLTYSKLKTVYGSESKYLTIEEDENDSLISIYDEKDELIVQKKYTNIKNVSIIKNNENYIIVGISGNALKVMEIDSNMFVTKQIETSYLINLNNQLKIYNNDNKVFVFQIKNNSLADNKVYEIDNELNILEKNFSSYDSNYLKSILKDKYYSLIHNEESLNNAIIHYNDSTYLSNNNILIGNNANNAFLRILDNENNEVLSKEFTEYEDFLNISIINKKIMILATKDESYTLIEISLSGEIIDSLDIEGTNLRMEKTGDKLLIISTNEKTTISIYKYMCDIEVEESVLGTIEVQNSSEPYKPVSIKVAPNSGYVLANITVVDSEDNVINLVNNEFIMPNNNVTVTANYVESVNNPETMDLILFFVIALVITVFIMSKTYDKYKWLRQ